MKVNKNEEKQGIRHRKDAEWLTYDICAYYMDKAKAIPDKSMSNITFRSLCYELKERCDITELQAINILNGYFISEYVSIYERMRNPENIKYKSDDKREYLEWLARQEDKHNGLDDYILMDEVKEDMKMDKNKESIDDYLQNIDYSSLKTELEGLDEKQALDLVKEKMHKVESADAQMSFSMMRRDEEEITVSI